MILVIIYIIGIYSMIIDYICIAIAGLYVTWYASNNACRNVSKSD